jgi:hypothetical protein
MGFEIEALKQLHGESFHFSPSLLKETSSQSSIFNYQLSWKSKFTSSTNFLSL